MALRSACSPFRIWPISKCAPASIANAWLRSSWTRRRGNAFVRNAIVSCGFLQYVIRPPQDDSFVWNLAFAFQSLINEAHGLRRIAGAVEFFCALEPQPDFGSRY